MFLRVLKLLTTTWLTTLLVFGCGSSTPPPPPEGLSVQAGESSAVVSWTVTPGVEYWLFYAPKSVAPTSTDMSKGWTDLAGGNVVIRVQSPATIINLANDKEYVFTVNGRVDGGPGGKGAALTYATTRLAGTNWTTSTTALSAAVPLRAATFSSVYVAGGAGGALMTSLDGKTYTAVDSTTTRNLNAAAFLGSYKLVGAGGTILVSADAITWTPQVSNTTNDLYGIGTNGLTTTVAVGAGGTILTSADGLTWSQAVSNTTRDLYAVAYSSLNGGIWIAVGAGGTMLQSADALTWTPISSGTTADLRGVSYALLPLATGATVADSAFVAVGAGGTILTSANGLSWGPITAAITSAAGTPLNPSNVSWNAVTYGTQFIVVGSGGNILTSTDGRTFTASAPTGTSQELFAVTRGYLGYSAAGASGTVLLSK